MFTIDQMNEIRFKRYELLRNLTREKAAEYIENPPAELRNTYLHIFLEAVDGISNKTSEKFHNAAKVNRATRLKDLSPNKRFAIATLLRYKL